MPASPSKEQIFNVISDIVEKSKAVISTESDEVLNYDVVELTLLLKSVGFRLDSLEFNDKCQGNDNDEKIEIEMKCKKTGLVSKMHISPSKFCTCPEKLSTNNNSFWEIQGVSKNVVQDSSSNLLPEISKKTNNFAIIMLKILLQHYKADFNSFDEPKEKLELKDVLERVQLKNKLNEIKSQLENGSAGLSATPSEETSPELCKSSTPSVKAIRDPFSSPGASLNVENDENKIEKKPIFGSTLSIINDTAGSDVLSKNRTFEKIIDRKETFITQAVTEARDKLESILTVLMSNDIPTSSQLQKNNNALSIATNENPRIVNKKTPASNNDSRRNTIGGRNDLIKKTSIGLKISSSDPRRKSFGGRTELIKKPFPLTSTLKPVEGDLRRSSVGGKIDQLKKIIAPSKTENKAPNSLDVKKPEKASKISVIRKVLPGSKNASTTSLNKWKN